HRPEPPNQATDVGTDGKLPDIGDEGREDQQGGCCKRRDQRTEHTHRHRRQPHAGHALDEAGEDEGGGDGCQEEELIVHEVFRWPVACAFADREWPRVWLPLIRLPAPSPRLRGEGMCRAAVPHRQCRRVPRPLSPQAGRGLGANSAANTPGKDAFAARLALLDQMLFPRISRSLPKISSIWCFSTISGGDMAMMSPVVRISRPSS